MSYQRISISADDVDVPNRDGSVTVTDLESVHVSLAGEARCNGDEESGAEWRCANCGEALREVYAEVPEERFESIETGHAGCDADEQNNHELELIPLSWANSAGITLDESTDTIAVRISVGDPRGAFVLSVERVRWTDEDGEHDELRLSVPTPEQSFLHMPLTPLASPGYFRIGA